MAHFLFLHTGLCETQINSIHSMHQLSLPDSCGL